MRVGKLKRDPVEVSGEVFGVGVTLVASDRELLGLMRGWLPPGWREGRVGDQPTRLTLVRSAPDTYDLSRDGEQIASAPLEEILGAFEWLLRTHIATAAPGHLFIHAATVAHNGRALVIPGPSFSGKSTLVTALVRAGATYYSDEYAVLNPEGLVLAYPKPISMRTGEPGKRLHSDPAQLGYSVGSEPVPIGLIVLAQYRSGATWSPVALSPAQATIELLPHLFAGEERARDALAMLGRALTGVTTLKGDRGDADAIIKTLLGRLDEIDSDAA